MRKSKYILYLVAPALLLGACGKKNPDSPGIEFMPDMYRSTSYETNSSSPVFADSMTNRQPVEGTIALGFKPYPYKNNNQGYELAGRWLKNPVDPTPENIGTGKVLYDKFCQHCHGATGQGDGHMVNIGKYPSPPPSYSGPLKNLSEGKMMHSIHHGKNMMGSHAAQLNMEERWKIIRYVQTLQGIDFNTMSADSVYQQRCGATLEKKKEK
ncbi:MAG: cytochrome c [Bacteroidia bacterium]|nr:cytochrome c [Bacteroidia bacterium]